MKLTLGDRILKISIYVIVGILTVICVIPLLYTFASSLSSGAALNAGKVFLWPVEFTTSAYRLLFGKSNLFQYFMNSVVVTVVGTVLSLIATVLCAYPLSKKYLLGRKKIAFFITFTMFFGGGMIPTFMLVKNLKLINSYWSLWLTGLISTYNMIVMRSFFEGIPEDLSDAARIDGCGEFRMLFNIYLPLSKASLATIALFYGVSNWNMYQKVMLYIQDTKKYTLPVFVQQMIFNLQQLDLDTADALAMNITDIVSESVKSAGVMVLVIPMLLVYPLLQKYFVKGVTLGAMKG